MVPTLRLVYAQQTDRFHLSQLSLSAYAPGLQPDPECERLGGEWLAKDILEFPGNWKGVKFFSKVTRDIYKEAQRAGTPTF
jgi:hypothetical protein